MTDATPVPAPAPGLFARAVGIISAPTETFKAVVANPKPAGMLFLVATVMALAIALPQFTESGRQAALDMQVQQTERFTGRQIDDAQYARMQTMGKYTPYISIVSMFIILPISALIFTAIYWVIFNAILGGMASFKQVLAVNTHAMVIGGLGTALGSPIQYMKGTASQVGPFNLGALVPMMDERSFIASFLGSISVFTLWGIAVTAIGLGVLYKRNSRNIAMAFFLVFALAVAGWAWFMSSR